MNVCECNVTLGNTGVPGCNPLFKVTSKIVFVPTFDSTGAKNKIAIATPYTQILLDASLNQSDATKRYYPTPILNVVAGERAESKFQTDPFGRKEKVKDGIRNMTAEIWKQGGIFLGQIDKVNCNDFSFYAIDINGNVQGMISSDEDGYLYPIRISKGSFDAIYMAATPEANEMVKIAFDIDYRETDSLLRMIAASDMTADWLEAEGLIDVNSIISSISTTGFTAKLVTKYGSVVSPVVDSGLLITDFALYNVTDSWSGNNRNDD